MVKAHSPLSWPALTERGTPAKTEIHLPSHWVLTYVSVFVPSHGTDQRRVSSESLAFQSRVGAAQPESVPSDLLQ